MERYTPLVTSRIWLTLLETNTLHTSPQDQHTVKIISIFNLINQSKSCQPIHIKVTLYKPLNPSCLHNFNRASVENKEYKISHASGFHVSEELVSIITCATTLIPVHSEIVIKKSIKQFIIHCWINVWLIKKIKKWSLTWKSSWFLTTFSL